MEHPGAGEMPGVPRATATRSLLPMVEDAPGRGSRAVPATHVGQDPEAIARDRAGTGFFLRRSSFVPVSALPDRAPSEVAMGRHDACRQEGSGVSAPVVSGSEPYKMSCISNKLLFYHRGIKRGKRDRIGRRTRAFRRKAVRGADVPCVVSSSPWGGARSSEPAAAGSSLRSSNGNRFMTRALRIAHQPPGGR